MINSALVFAAGFGKRMGALTAQIPKSLIKIHGKPILYYVLENLLKNKFKQIIINTHYLHKQIDSAIANFNNPTDTKIIIVHEPIILETGGAVKNIFKYLDQDVLATFFSDTIVDSKQNCFIDLQAYWDPVKMDILFLLHETEKAVGYTGSGDFNLLATGQLTKKTSSDKFKYMNAGSLILKPSLIHQHPSNVFSLNEYYKGDRLYGIVNKGDWYHVSRPEDIIACEKKLKSKIIKY